MLTANSSEGAGAAPSAAVLAEVLGRAATVAAKLLAGGGSTVAELPPKDLERALALLAIVESACACHAHAGESTGMAEDLARLCAAVDRLGLAIWARWEDGTSPPAGGGA